MATELVIKTSRAPMPGSCMGGHRYYRVALLEVIKGHIPKKIDTRSRGIVRIVQIWEPVYMGTSDRCGWARAMAEAEALSSKMGQTTIATY